MLRSYRQAGSRKGYTEFANAILVVFAVLLQWYGHQGGLLQTPDSCNYLAATESFEGYRYFPPLFPIVLWVFGKSWIWIQLLLLIGVCILVIRQTNQIIKDPLIAFACQVSIILSVHLLMIGVFLWSELLFLFLLLLFIQYLEKNFIVAIILGFFLCIQRNAGLLFVIGAAIYLWDIRKSLLLLVLSSSGFVLWNIYAGIVDEHQYFSSIGHNANIVATELMRVIAPLHGFVILIVLAAVFYFPKLKLLSILVVVYLVGIICIFSYESYDADRYIAVIVPFFMILLFRSVEIAVSKQTSAVRTVLMVLIVCWLAYPLSRTVKNAIQWHNVSFTSYFCATQF